MRSSPEAEPTTAGSGRFNRREWTMAAHVLPAERTMKTHKASLLALALALASGAAAAQTVVPAAAFDTGDSDRYATNGRYDQGSYDYARVIRVVPVRDGRAYPASGRECRSRDYADDYYGADGYGRDGYYGRDDYYGRRDSGNGRAMASVVGSVIGALVGSQVGGGSGRIATSAIGSAVGAIAGQQVYENARRQRNVGRVTVCDPVRDGYGGYDQYDVTYEYAGRTYTTRTSYDPGDRIRVRVVAE